MFLDKLNFSDIDLHFQGQLLTAGGTKRRLLLDSAVSSILVPDDALQTISSAAETSISSELAVPDQTMGVTGPSQQHVQLDERGMQHGEPSHKRHRLTCVAAISPSSATLGPILSTSNIFPASEETVQQQQEVC
jgi:hypothetical protein